MNCYNKVVYWKAINFRVHALIRTVSKDVRALISDVLNSFKRPSK
jgi:hypothetical protein